MESLLICSVSQGQSHPGAPCYQHGLDVRFLNVESRIPRSYFCHSECNSLALSAKEQPVSSKRTRPDEKTLLTSGKTLGYIEDKVKRAHERGFQGFGTS